METLLDIKELQTCFTTPNGVAKAVDGVSFTIQPGEVLGLVGESGSGKSVTALSVLRLIQEPTGKIAGGEILFNGRNLLSLSEPEMRKIRGNEIGMIFQEPMTSLNPVFTVGYQIAEVYQTHRGLSKKESLAAAQKMLESVKIPSPEQRLHEYPHQLSGGMRQRVMIAMALACQPSLLIADEPTTALDVTVQAQILELMKELKDQMQSSILMITHDLGIIAGFADRVAVMYAGQIVEQGPVEDIFEHPSHPYTRGLLNSIPKFKTGDERKQGYTKLITIEGTVPDPLHFPTGCRFNPRCKYAIPECYQQMPLLKEIVPGHQACCYVAEKLYQDNHESK